ncbi:MAG: CDP-diacylglycerol--serine O-phosphatidyltransferase [Legionella sp.]|nr:MAG: CDP-diacylglycerol--serine O-phosphatidyltransferase [Legionella sp.]
MKHKSARFGIYLLPNLFTTAALFAAFYSLVASMKMQYEAAIIAIFVGMIADGLDGRIARLTNTQTSFGAEYDSLSDMVTFGVAPALLLYSWALHQLGKLGWLVAFIYAAAVALRLARFNTQLETADKRYFQGLSSPPAAATVASFIWLCQQNEWTNDYVLIFVSCLAVILAILMVSNIRYYSFKELDFKGKVPFLYVLLLVVLFAAVASDPSLIIWLTSIGYAASGPFQTLMTVQRVRKHRRRLLKQRRKE